MKRSVQTIFAMALCALALAMAQPETAQAAPPKKRAIPQAAPVEGTVNLNTATAEELQLLPGVGKKKAEAIVAWRKANGRFQRIEDLRKVKGFGRKTFQKLRPHLAISGKTTLRKVETKTSGRQSRP